MLASFFVAVLILGISSAEHASFEACSKADQECFRRTSQEFLRKGAESYPAEKLVSLDPFTIDKLEFETPEAHYTLANNKVTGFKNVEVSKINFEEKQMTIVLALNLAVESDFVGVYKLKPEPVTLKAAETRNIDAVVNINYPVELVDGKDGEKHFKIGKESITFELKKPTTYSAPKEFTDAYNANAEVKAIDTKNLELPELKNKFESEIINHLIAACVENFRRVDEVHPAKHFVKDL